MIRRRISGADRFELADGVQVEHSEDAVTLFQERTARYWQVNLSAWDVVAALGDGRTVTEVVEGLHEQTGVDRERATADVLATVRSLLDARLVRRS